MKSLHKKLCKAVVLAFAIIFASCSSTTPLQGNNIAVTNNVQVLGRVTIERDTTESGYTILLKEALKQYPDADDIVNILVDGKTTGKKQSYIMSALVVKYTN